jgi:serine/threonine protein kinase
MITVGTCLGPYEILSQLGTGGKGEAYRAKDSRLNRTVAVKVLTSQVSDRAEVRVLFSIALGTSPVALSGLTLLDSDLSLSRAPFWLQAVCWGGAPTRVIRSIPASFNSSGGRKIDRASYQAMKTYLERLYGRTMGDDDGD